MPGDFAPGPAAGGVAADVPEPAFGVQLQVGFAGLQQAGRQPPALILDVQGGPVHRDAAQLQRPGRVGPGAERDEVGVPVDHGDLVHGDAQVVLDQHGPGGVVALPVRAASGVDRGGAVVADLQPGGLTVVRVGRGDLDVARHADAELDHVSTLSPPGLFGPEPGVAGAGQHLVQRPDVVPGVIAGPARALVRELVGRDEVPAPHFGRVHPYLGREQVHGPLDRGRRLRPAGAAVRVDRRGVGHHHPVRGFHVADVVGAGRHQAGEEREEPAQPQVSAGVLDDIEAVWPAAVTTFGCATACGTGGRAARANATTGARCHCAPSKHRGPVERAW